MMKRRTGHDSLGPRTETQQLAHTITCNLLYVLWYTVRDSWLCTCSRTGKAISKYPNDLPCVMSSHMMWNLASGTEGSVVSSWASGVIMLVTVESVSKTSQMLNSKCAWVEMLRETRIFCCSRFQFQCCVWMWVIRFHAIQLRIHLYLVSYIYIYMYIHVFDWTVWMYVSLFFSLGGCKDRRIIQTSMGLSCAKKYPVVCWIM